MTKTQTRWHYYGDQDIAYGGLYYSLATFEWGYADAVRVTPCSNEGGPTDMFRIDFLSISFHPTEIRADVLAEYGLSAAAFAALTPAARRHAAVQCHAAVAYDCGEVMIVLLGSPRGRRFTDFRPTHYARAGSDLRRIALSLAKGRGANLRLIEIGGSERID